MNDRPAPSTRRRGPASLSATGVLLATAAWLVAWLPSLLPTGTVLQGVVCGLLAAVGYAAGAAIGACGRLVRRSLRARRMRAAIDAAARGSSASDAGAVGPAAAARWSDSPAPRRYAFDIVTYGLPDDAAPHPPAAATPADAAYAGAPGPGDESVMGAAGAAGGSRGPRVRAADVEDSVTPRWYLLTAWFAVVFALGGGLAIAPVEAAQARAIGAPQLAAGWLVATVVGLIVALALIGGGRGLRAATRGYGRLLGRHAQQWPPAARTAAAVAATVASVVSLLAVGLVGTTVAFNRIDASATGQQAPSAEARSGSPASLISFDSLGRQGRQFVTQGANPRTIRSFAGLESADSPRARADLAVADMLRAGGAGAPVWIGITTTGNGFIDPVAAQAAETATNGRAALVAIQYSTLPSWLSFLTDQSKAREAGVALYESLAAARDALPAGGRPKLVLYGESLGAFGSPAPFTGMDPAQVAERIDGALWVGPPAATDPITGWTYAGQPPVWQPVVGAGQVARYAATAAAAASPPGDGSWPGPRILVLQNPTDPVVWFSPSLVLSRPAWLDQPRGPGVQEASRWTPALFFLQVALDLPQAVSMPSGYGHDYSAALPEAWRQVLGGS